MVEIIDLTTSPEPEPKRKGDKHSDSPAQIPFRQSPHKRRKLSHLPGGDTGHESEDGRLLLGRFDPRPAPPTRNGLNGHGTSPAYEQQAPHRDNDPFSEERQQSTDFQHTASTPFISSTLARLRGLGSSFINNFTTKKTELTEEQDRATSHQPGINSVAVKPAPVHKNGTQTSISHSSPHKKPMQQALVVPQDYPHGLPLPRHVGSSQPQCPAAVRKTPIPLPTRAPARSATAQVLPIPPPTFPAAVPAPTTQPAALSAIPAAPIAPPLPISTTPLPRPRESSPGRHTSSAKPVKFSPWSEEEDSLIVYLRNGLGFSFKDIAPLLTGRSLGAANTRYCNRLKYGFDMGKAIKILQKSKWAYLLQPMKHAELLARPAPQAPGFPVQVEIDAESMVIGQLSSTARTTVASQRERRAAQRPNNYYSKEHYAQSIEDDVIEAEPEKVAILDQHRNPLNVDLVGTEIRSQRRSRRLPDARKRFRFYRPYLSHHQRAALRNGFDEGEWHESGDWKGTEVHIPFTKEEVKSLEHAVTSKFDNMTWEAALDGMTEPEIHEIASYARSFLPMRTKESIEAFLRDAADRRLSKELFRLGSQNQESGINSVLRNRELGMRTTRKDYSKYRSIVHLQTPALKTMGPSLNFTGTSGDVNTVAWAPDGIQFAAGSACLVDSDSMQYNRPNNLLFGDVSSRKLYELADHFTHREMPESGVNSSWSMHVTQDPRLFQTVSMVAFSPDGSLMYSAGYDAMVRVYDITGNGVPEKIDPALRHTAKVDLLSVSAQGLLATGCQRSKKNSVKVINPYELLEEWDETINPVMHNFSSRKAAERPGNGIFPSALRFDPSGDFLLAGFASTSREDMTYGETCLWDVRTGVQMTISPDTRNVLDVTWNTNRWQQPLFAVGCVAGVGVNRGVRSVIKMYDPRAREKYGMSMELDCPALDMNDVLFCPHDDNLVVAACTNGKTYVWDLRQPVPEDHLYSLVHDEPLMELGDGDAASRERLDTGVRFCSWGHDRRRLYTGSSDGVVKAWDPYRSPEDVFVKDIVQLNSGVMSGAFSPDHNSLLLGEVNGTINVLEVGQSGRSIKDMDPFDLIAADKEHVPSNDQMRDNKGQEEAQDDESGIATARHLLQTDRMTLRPMGSLPIRQAVQGSNYDGPWDKADDANELRKATIIFQRKLSGRPTRQCDIPACHEAGSSKIVPEEVGDSGRSADRIPGALRALGLPPSSQQKNNRMVSPALTCSGCRVRLARPGLDNAGENGSGRDKPLCERCSFSCLRCGRVAQILADGERGERISCLSCRLAWRADVLGYRLLSSTLRDSGSSPGERKTTKETERERDKRRRHDYLASEGEECLEEYYHRLWQDRPPSPL